MKRPSFLPVLIGTGFGSGFSPFAPGTAGALLASIIWIALYFLLPFTALLWTTAALVVLFTFAGIWAANKLESCWGEDCLLYTSFAGMTLDEIERQTILQALERHKGNLSQVATALGRCV